MSQHTQAVQRRTQTQTSTPVAKPAPAKKKADAKSLSKLSLLKQGVSGAQVKLLTKKLVEGGYLKAPTDKFDSEVEAAVRKYQKDKGLQVDGIVGQQTWGSFYGVKAPPGSNLLKGGGGTSAVGGTSGGGHSHVHGPNGVDRAPDAGGDIAGGKRVTAYINGRAQQITVVPVGNGEYMRADAAKNYKTMLAAAQRAGISLSSTSGFRTMAEQQALYARYGSPRAATPGHSNHQNGISMDIGGVNSYGTAAYNWLKNNASKYGFKNDVAGEYWHWTYYGR